jgi:hypothetical protein
MTRPLDSGLLDRLAPLVPNDETIKAMKAARRGELKTAG